MFFIPELKPSEFVTKVNRPLAVGDRSFYHVCYSHRGIWCCNWQVIAVDQSTETATLQCCETNNQGRSPSDYTLVVDKSGMAIEAQVLASKPTQITLDPDPGIAWVGFLLRKNPGG